MVDLIINGGTVATMDAERRVIERGAVAVDGTDIVAVGGVDEVSSAYDADRVVDASGTLVLPGLINTHVHVPDILYRGRGKGRGLHDWLFNVKHPFVAAMDAEDHAVAAELYCRETLRAGVTTFVENAGGLGNGYDAETVRRKLSVYDTAGIRNVYAHGFLDRGGDSAFDAYVEIQRRKEPGVAHASDPPLETDAALDGVEALIERYHGSADGRQSVWPGPFLAWGVSPEGLAGAYELAEKYDVMTTTHTSESPIQERNLASSVEYLESAGYLGERTLLGHCVQVSEADVRRLAATDTKVAHNVATNCSIATGIAPVPAMHAAGVTVGLGTDNIAHNDTANLIADMRLASLVHKVGGREPSRMPAERVLAMATIDAARAIGRADSLGSLEAGKLADIVVLDLDHPHLTPYTDVPSLLVYQATGTEVTTVLCNGEIVVEDGECRALGSRPDPVSIRERSRSLVERAGLDQLVH
ncbi:amidohydrolase family protein [Salinigranum sp. GCM10025319]|uniref:amidohydrolase family protein n=1 Tax=Salinigranum sp. GCM10025319 TaxID=3252687 RepID=UPI003607BD30